MATRLYDIEELVMGLLDGVFRSTCPHLQDVARESYRATRDTVTLLRQTGDMSLE